MKVVVREAGNKPMIQTYGAMNARNGCNVLSALMAPQEWADLGILTIDYEGDGFTPALEIKCVKFAKGGARLETDWVLSLDDAFGADNFSNSVALDIVQGLKETMEEAMRQGPPNG